MKLSEDLAWRGLIKDKTFAKNSWLDKPQKFYHGVDASSDSLTVGNLAAILLARRLMDHGWRAVLLAGGATSLIGDPGGKDIERELLPRKEIKQNIEDVKEQIKQLFSSKEFELVDNYSWFSKILYLDFLREYGKRFSMTELMQREFVTDRMKPKGTGISYAEFSYSLVQGYDFLRLYRDKKVVLQIGGSDQWGNMLSGVSMIRKKLNEEAHALSMPLVINKQSGRKFGKSEEGAIWLDANKTTAFRFYQFWFNTSDEDANEYLKIFTLLPRAQIESLVKEHKQVPSERTAQKKLAFEVTKLVHGEDQAHKQQRISEALTGEREVGRLENNEIATIREEIPHRSAEIDSPIAEALKETGLAASNTEARRLLSSRAVYINGKPAERENFEPEDFRNGKALLRRGKAFKDSALIEIN